MPSRHAPVTRPRALVTRPRAEAAGLAEALDRRGIDALVEPLLDIDYRDEALPDLGRVQAVLCTSANGVRALARRTGERGIALFAVGEATAARARAEGFARVESAGGNVEDLAALVRERLRPEAGRLLHVAGSDVAGDLAGALRDGGFAVDRIVLYEARPVVSFSAPTEAALRNGVVDFALFFSPRTAAVFARLSEQAGMSTALRGVTAVSISAAADRALGDLAFRRRLVAKKPDQEGLLAALDQLLATERAR
ncbi:MAG: uroporphyrinogen-III synthase [Alphaproteobacteria bacterium]|nr:uroporphyrinogen-III synthase [Alphaproteobacteria bacterium]